MPLVRVQVRNEYGLGKPELYRGADEEDPKALLQGLAVSGLVGILRQLGDLAEFAAEIFHDLHEQVMFTASRSHKMKTRLRHIETTLPQIEKAVFSQTSHIHFAYTSAVDWHVNIGTEENHFLCSDLPRCMTKAYEECRDPPQLFLLDKFDPAGAGSCLKRYSDPSFFKSIWTSSEVVKSEQIQRRKEACKSKRKEHQRRKRENPLMFIPQGTSRIHLASPDINEQSPSAEHMMFEQTSQHQMSSPLIFYDSKDKGHMEHEVSVNSAVISEGTDEDAVFSPKSTMHSNTKSTILLDNQSGQGVLNSSSRGSSQDLNVTWDEKKEIRRDLNVNDRPHNGMLVSHEKLSLSLRVNSNLFQLDHPVESKKSNPTNNGSGANLISDKFSSVVHIDETTSETDNYLDALTTMDSEIETGSECPTKQMFVIDEDSHVSPDYSELITSEISVLTHEPLVIDTTPSSNCNREIDLPCIQFEHETTGTDGCESEDLHDKKVNNNSSDSQESQSSEISSEHSIKCWTNGSLLGLEPSKPLVLAESSVIIEKPVVGSQIDELSLSNKEKISNTTQERDQQSITSMEKVGQLFQLKDDSLQCSGPFYNNMGLDASSHQNFDEPSLKVTGVKLKEFNESACNKHSDSPACSNVEVSPSGSKENNYETSYKMLSLNHKHNTSGFLIKESHSNIDVLDLHSSKNDQSAVEGKSKLCKSNSQGQARVEAKLYKPNSRQQLDCGSNKNHVSSQPDYSCPSSPPLELMKISFHPIDILETSKLKLEFFDRNQIHDGIEDDLFPSFQLLPDPCNPVKDTDSESDDDSFCKSSPYLSEEILSNCSESNSELWESSKDLGECDPSVKPLTSNPASHTDYKASSNGNLNKDHSKSFQSDYLFDLPSFENVSSLMGREEKMDYDHSSGDLVFSEVLNSELQPPLPPPLPPVQWTMKHSVEQMTTETNPPGIQDDLIVPNSGKHKRGHTNVQIKLKQTAISNDLDEREELLYRIRTKSFNLRRTTAKQNIPNPVTNVKVVAILEKANAIRKACIGSDEGGDDENWSDN